MEAGDDSPTSELLAPPPPPLPERIKRSGKRARDGPLLFGTQLVKHEGKDDELVVEAAPQGAKQSSHRSTRKSSRRRPFSGQGQALLLHVRCLLTPPIY